MWSQQGGGGSLADVARQVRAQKQSQPQSDTNKAQQVVDELMDDQSDTGAPGGFKTYNQGDYKVWVPAPYHVEGQDDAGVVLSGPMVGSKRPIVLVGTPVVAHWGKDDDAFQDAVRHFARLYTPSANCTKTTVANHAAYQCGMAAATLLGGHVTGKAVFVRASGNMYPLFCLAPSDSRSRDLINSARADRRTKTWARESLDREEDDMKSLWQKCDTFFGSIHFKGDALKQVSAQSTSANTAK